MSGNDTILFRILVLSFILLLFIPCESHALKVLAGDNILVPAGETIDDDIVAMGSNVRIGGDIDGDIIATGGTIDILGNVSGDLMSAGGMTRIDGFVADDVRSAGNVYLTGDVGSDMLAFGGVVDIGEGTSIGSDLFVAAGMLTLAGDVGRNVGGGAGNAIIAGDVAGNVTLECDTLRIVKTARINGNLNYTSENEALIEPGAEISGEIIRNEPAQTRIEEQEQARQIMNAGRVISFFALLIVGLIMVYLMPRRSALAANSISSSFWKSALTGFAGLFLTPFVIIFFLATIVGIPIALITLVLYLIAIYLSHIFVGLVIGIRLMKYAQSEAARKARKPVSMMWSLFIGLLILKLLVMLPVLGWFISFVALVIGLGAILLTEYEFISELREKKLL